ncbi:hypothetical protein ACQKEM_00955 [Pseudomonas sp. NPDC077382]
MLEFRQPGFFERNVLRKKKPKLLIDGIEYAYDAGVWACWVPKLRCKFLYSVDGFVHCIHKTAPARELLLGGTLDLSLMADPAGKYTLQEWYAIFSKEAAWRVAELYIATSRLACAGLGPQPLGIFMARQRIANGVIDKGGVFGICTDDATRLPAGPSATEQDMLKAGVRPDKIKSCIRQQLNGYVIDLNSVAGVVPVDADAEISRLAEEIKNNFYASLCSKKT